MGNECSSSSNSSHLPKNSVSPINNNIPSILVNVSETSLLPSSTIEPTKKATLGRNGFHPCLGAFTFSSGSENDASWSSRDPWIEPPWYVRHTPKELLERVKLIKKSYSSIGKSSTFQSAVRLTAKLKAKSKGSISSSSSSLKLSLPSNINSDFPSENLTPSAFLSFHFYESLFLILPKARGLFSKGIEIQGAMVQSVISMLLNRLEVNDADSLEDMRNQIINLVQSHNKKDITLNQYNIVGEALVTALEHCCGPEQWNEELQRSWYMLYSALLDMIVVIFKEKQREEQESKDIFDTDNIDIPTRVPNSSVSKGTCPFATNQDSR